MATTAAAGNRNKKIAIVVAALVAVAAVVGILLAINSGGGDQPSTVNPAGVSEVDALLKGVPMSGNRLGSESAPVTIEEFADVQCPFCAQASATVVPQVVQRYVRPGTASMVFRTMAFVGDDSTTGALAAQAAAKQDKMWPFVEVLYKNQGTENSGWVSDGLVRGTAQAVGLDVTKFDADRAAAEAQTALDADMAGANDQKVTSTPTFVITGPRGKRVVAGATDIAPVAAAVAAVRGASN
jgi:protein-disulfide isomerase